MEDEREEDGITAALRRVGQGISDAMGVAARALDEMRSGPQANPQGANDYVYDITHESDRLDNLDD